MKASGWGGSAWNTALSIIVVVALLGALGMLGYVLVVPRVGEKFTEFYVLGLSGKATDYPSEVKVGEDVKIIVGIVNHEHKVVSYSVEVRIDGVRDNQAGPLELEPDEKWEEIVIFTPDRAGDSQKVEFLLYKNGGNEPYLKLHLLVNVKE